MKKGHSRLREGTWQWPRTEWSASGHIPRLLRKDPEKLNELLLRYRTPMKAYLVAAFPGLEDEAEELLQDFAQDRILRKGWLDKAERGRGRFRDFLKVSLKNFVRDRLRARQAHAVSREGLGLELPAEENAIEAFGLEWARTILAEVLKRMEADCQSPRGKRPDRVQIWETFRLRLLQPILEGAGPVSYEELVSKLGIASPAVAQNLLISAKRMFKRHLEAVIAEYEQSSEAARTELRDLRQFLSKLARVKRG